MSGEFYPGDVISYIEMCTAVGASLQRGMNYRLCGKDSVILMSRRVGAPYEDQIDETGTIIIYEGHDCAKTSDCRDPKGVDQPEFFPSGGPTQNGLFAAAVKRHKEDNALPERARVFEKIKDGIWTYNGVFELVDCRSDYSNGRRVFKFTLKLVHTEDHRIDINRTLESEDDRIIPSWVKLEVWKRDKGVCQIPGCEAKTRLHFDHIIPYSKGGSSKDPNNIQILCGRHNLAKHDKIE
jgi:5-methylcytosine-specific restriction endonuclease McrA